MRILNIPIPRRKVLWDCTDSKNVPEENIGTTLRYDQRIFYLKKLTTNPTMYKFQYGFLY